MPHPSQLSIDAFLKNCEFTRTRRSGPGGQHRNKVETAVVVEHRPSGLRAEASERRSQHANRKQSIRRLRLRLALEIRTDPADSPTPLWTSRLTHGRISVNPEHDEFPALLAECLNVVANADYELSAAAAQLTTTASQLVKFLQLEPPALAMVNQARSHRRLGRLK